MTRRLRITGFYELEDGEVDADDSSGVTAEFYESQLIGPSGIAVADLLELQTELVD